MDVSGFVGVLLGGERAVPRSTTIDAARGVAPPCAQKCAASSRLARRAASGTAGRVQLQDLG